MKDVKQLRIRLFSLQNSGVDTDSIVANFEHLLLQDKVYDKCWGFVRKKAELDYAFYLGGGRRRLPKRMLVFDTVAMPDCMEDELPSDDKVEPEVLEWCDSADVFVCCLDSRKLPPSINIARCLWRMSHADRSKKVVYALLNCEAANSCTTFEEYANLQLELNELNQTLNLPYANNGQVIKGKKRKVTLCKNLYCFTTDIGSQMACLLFCINQLYKGKAEILAQKHYGLKYITTNKQNKKYYMEKSIKIAVVGTSGNGKSHFLKDLCLSLRLKGFGASNLNDNEYAPFSLLESENREVINPTDVKQVITKSKHHFKGDIAALNKTIEVMDLPGEVFQKDTYITEVYPTLLKIVKNYSRDEVGSLKKLIIWIFKRAFLWIVKRPFLWIARVFVWILLKVKPYKKFKEWHKTLQRNIVGDVYFEERIH